MVVQTWRLQTGCVVPVLATVPTCALFPSGLTLDCVACESNGRAIMLQVGLTALLHASNGGHGAVVQMLLDAGANVEAATNVGGPDACYSPDFSAVTFGFHT